MEWVVLGACGVLAAVVVLSRRGASRRMASVAEARVRGRSGRIRGEESRGGRLGTPRPAESPALGGIRFRDLPPDRPATRPIAQPFPSFHAPRPARPILGTRGPLPRARSRPRAGGSPVPEPPQAVTLDLSGVRDALSGAPLEGALELYRCTCEASYLRESVEVIRSRNGGRCVCCGSTSIVAVRGSGVAAPGPWAAPRTAAAPAASSSHPAASPEVVTLANYCAMAGRVVTFEGHVPRVLVSRSGRGLAVMFEDTSWNRGLKLVLFPRAIARFGGFDAVRALEGRNVRVRGLLQRHAKFGYQIVAHDPAMILAVR